MTDRRIAQTEEKVAKDLAQVEERLAILAGLVSREVREATEKVASQYRETLRDLAKR